MKFSLYSMTIDLYKSCSFQDIIGPTIKVFFSILSPILIGFFIWIPCEVSCLHFSNRFNLVLMVSEMIRVKGFKKGPTPKTITFRVQLVIIVCGFFSVEFLRQTTISEI